MACTVLLADRHALMRQGLRAILSADAEVEILGEVDSGRAAVEKSAAMAPDILVVDTAMTDLDSAEVVRQVLRQQHGTAVLALSGSTRRLAAMLGAGAAGYVLKEDVYRELRRAVRALRAGKGYLCPGTAQAAGEIIRKRHRSAGAAGRHLGAREREVLRLVAEGLSTPQIAKTLQIASTTVETHRRNIMHKLDAHNVVELTRYAIRVGLTSLEG